MSVERGHPNEASLLREESDRLRTALRAVRDWKEGQSIPGEELRRIARLALSEDPGEDAA
jgi:hypothetical protein